MIFKRKIYDKMLKWKYLSNGQSALLIEGARRIGKSTVVEEFAKHEYKSYILIDFSNSKKSFTTDMKKAFESTEGYDVFFQTLQLLTNVKLYERESVIVFDEVQMYPKARQMIKYLVADGRYDYIETGSLITLKKNSAKITIPSEEHRIQMYPMNFEEFLIAFEEFELLNYIKDCYKQRKPLIETVHKKAYRLFRTYMAVGGMPQAINEYINSKDFEKVDLIKKNIINLYRDDMYKISRKSSSVTPLIIYDKIQSFFSNHSFEIQPSSFSNNTKLYTCLNNVEALESSKIVNVAYEIKNIDTTLNAGYNLSNVKVYSADTGLLVTKIYLDTNFLENKLYKSIILDKLSVDEGFLFENVVAQELISNGNPLKYNSFYIDGSNKKYSIDFIIKENNKIIPIEVKSSSYRAHSSIDEFVKKYHQYIGEKVIIYSKNLQQNDNCLYLPIYMTMCL